MTLIEDTLDALNGFAKEEGKKRHDDLVNCAEKMISASDLSLARNDEEKIELLLKKHRAKDLVADHKLDANLLDDVIEVHIKFVNSGLNLDSFKFVIYDTPGSNSVMFREHADILKDSLEQQTNGLPIFVTNPDSMDETDNNDIMEIINELGGALDSSNMMLVVNKADEKAKTTLLKKSENKDNLALMKWKSSRVYFVSAIMGLGAKKVDSDDESSWIDEDYCSIYFEKERKFSDTESKFYMSLPEYNILPADSKSRIMEKAPEDVVSKRILWNSGIACVEEDIDLFAQKNALYNKCAQAILYLTEAIKSVECDIIEAERTAQAMLEETTKRLDDKKKSLMQELDKVRKEKIDEHVTRYTNEIAGPRVKKYVDADKIKKIVEEQYKYTEGIRGYQKVDEFNRRMKKSFKDRIGNYVDSANRDAEKYWRKRAEEMKSALIQVVTDSPHLTPYQKDILRKVVLQVRMIPQNYTDLNLKNNGIEEKFFIFPFIRWARFDLMKVADTYTKHLSDQIQNKNNSIIHMNECNYKEWTQKLMTELKSKLISFNPQLNHLSQNLDSQKRVIREKKTQREFLQRELLVVEKILDFTEV